MINITQLRKNIFTIVTLMMNSSATIEVVYRGVVYDMHFEKTDKQPQRARMRSKSSFQVAPIETTQCECGSLRFNGVCVNRDCPKYNLI